MKQSTKKSQVKNREPNNFARATAVTKECPPLCRIGVRERRNFQEIVTALEDAGIDELPQTCRGDTVRGLHSALESLITPLVGPRLPHSKPFNITLTNEETALARAVYDEVWIIGTRLLCGLHYFRPRGYVSRWGAEVPASWSPGDFDDAITEARRSLARLEILNEKLSRLESRKHSKVAQARPTQGIGTANDKESNNEK